MTGLVKTILLYSHFFFSYFWKHKKIQRGISNLLNYSSKLMCSHYWCHCLDHVSINISRDFSLFDISVVASWFVALSCPQPLNVFFFLKSVPGNKFPVTVQIMIIQGEHKQVISYLQCQEVSQYEFFISFQITLILTYIWGLERCQSS